MSTITATIQLRRDTAANWNTNNPTLLAGELGFETNTKRAKLGDGTTAWNDLLYIDNLGLYMPLAGGTMDTGARIGWANGSFDREAGAAGREIECSVGYRWQWVSGRMILRQVNSGQIQRVVAIDGVTPGATDDISEGFIVGTRWEVSNGTIYECTDASDGAAVWAVRSSGTNTGDQTITLTGDVTGTGTGSFAATIANQVVTFAKMQHISTAHLLGRHASGTGDVQQINIDGGLELNGANLRRAALTGDVTASAGNNATAIANDAVTNAKMANMAQATIKGRQAGGGTGDPEDLTASEARTAMGLASGALINVTPTFLNYTGGSVANSTLNLSDIDSSAGFSSVGAGFYEFMFTFTYNAAATTTGCRFALNGSVTFDFLSYQAVYTTLSTDRSTTGGVAFELGQLVVSSVATTNNVCVLEGRINITATGNFVPRFASEVNASAITVTAVTGFLRRIA
jgi:hypothetical protein